MTMPAKTAKKEVCDRLEFRIKTADSRLDELKEQAQRANANLQLHALSGLLSQRQRIHQLLNELDKSEEPEPKAGYWERAKADLEDGIAQLEKSLQEIEAMEKEG